VIPPIPAIKTASSLSAQQRQAQDFMKGITYTGVQDSAKQSSLSSEDKSKAVFDFIEFLRSNPETTKFVYLRPIPCVVKIGQPFFNPYNLEIVEYADLDTKSSEGYYTLSARVSQL
jgi:hypothetical protein